MTSTVKVISTKVTGLLALGARVVKVGYVEQTDAWRRVHVSPELQQKFEETAKKQATSFKDNTDMIAFQETPHESDSDQRTHFTAVEIDGQGTVLAKRHFPVE